ncbi:DUF421 domain-containing protein [Actinomyces howellii]|uniref:Protein of uncharacterized function (DUF421) n=1 Tax=Actinomyces howellii TaxID=52771 RepID=A0A3S4QZJ0_9ACTO|nr:YetF domain-containing protein [Actinomyces howellii]VEG26214.1 Protein of uncharacterised function (DUF421) [Actinomyces howellii]
MWTDLFVMTVPVADKVVRTVVVYLAIAVLLRVAGKRLMAQMNNLDLVVVLLLSNVVQNAIIGPDNSLLGGLLGAVVLIVVNVGLDRWAQVSGRLRWLTEGTGSVVVRDGRVDHRRLRRLGTSERELAGALHRQGADDVTQVELAVIEPGGDIDVRLRPGARAVTRDELDAAVERILAAVAQQAEPRGRQEG